MRGQCSSWLSHLTLFVLKNIHLSSSYVRQSPTTNDLGLTDDDTKTLPTICNFLNASSKALARTPNSKSSASNARSGQIQCLPRFSACVWQSTGSACGTRPAPALRVQHARVSVSAPRNRGASRLSQASRSSRRGRSLPRTISHCGSGRGDTSRQSSGTSWSAPLSAPRASPH